MTTTNTTMTQPDAAPELNVTIDRPAASAPLYTAILDTELGSILLTSDGIHLTEIGRASCRERV